MAYSRDLFRNRPGVAYPRDLLYLGSCLLGNELAVQQLPLGC